MAKDRERLTDPNLPALDAGMTQYWLSPKRIRGMRPIILALVIGGALFLFFGSEILYRLRPSLAVAAPPGFCALDPGSPADKRLLAAADGRLGGINERRAKARTPLDRSGIEAIDVLGSYVDCGQLDRLRADGTAMPDLVMTVISTRVTVQEGLPVTVERQELLETWDDVFAGAVGNQLIRDAVDITGGLSDAPGVGFSPAGVPPAVQDLRRDQYGLYRGRQNWVSAGPEPDLVAVTAITTIEGSLVLGTIVDTGRHRSFDQLFADIQAATEQMIRLNDDL